MTVPTLYIIRSLDLLYFYSILLLYECKVTTEVFYGYERGTVLSLRCAHTITSMRATQGDDDNVNDDAR